METKHRILETLEAEAPLKKSEIASRLGIDPSRSGRQVREMASDEYGWVNIDQSGRSHLVELTKAGKQVLEMVKETSAGGNPTSSVTEEEQQPGEWQGEVTSHKHQVGFGIENLEELGREGRWRKRWIEKQDKEFDYDETNDTYTAYIQEFKIRITKETVYIHIGERREGSVPEAMDTVLRDCLEARDEVEARSPLELSSRPVTFEIWMSEHHLGLVDHPLAVWIKEQPDLALGDFSVHIDGEKRVFTDDTPSATLEAASDYREEDMRHLEDRIEWILRNKEVDQELREEIPGRTDDIEKWLRYLVQLQVIDTAEGMGQARRRSRKPSEGSEQSRGAGSCEKFEGVKYSSASSWKRAGRQGGEADERLRELESKLEDRLDKFRSGDQGEWEDLLE